MELAAEKIKDLCEEQGWRLKDLLDKAGVSRTAYYSLMRNDTVLPKSIHALADELGVSPLQILTDPAEQEKNSKKKSKK